MVQVLDPKPQTLNSAEHAVLRQQAILDTGRT